MEREDMIRLVTEEVMRRLGVTQPVQPTVKQVLALFTGGALGLEEALVQLAQLQNQGVRLTAVLSKAAESVIGVERLRKALGTELDIRLATDPLPKQDLKAADIVLVPVLTQNTAAKLARTLADTTVTTLVMQALLMGKPVIAARNAADPKDPWRVQGGMGAARPTLTRALQENLKTLESYGVVLVEAGTLAAEAAQQLDLTGTLAQVKETAQKPSLPKKGQGRRVIDAAMIQVLAAQGETALSVGPQDLLTPLARDVARECGVEIR
nr:flavoprotein [uncultured Anaeromusa sp.]